MRNELRFEKTNIRLKRFSQNLKSHIWNRKVVQMGMSDMALEKLEEVKDDLGASREVYALFADVIEFDEGRID